MRRLLFTALAILISFSSCAQSNGAYKEKTVFKNSQVEFRQIDQHTWHGNGNMVYNESVYLIEGETSAILIDAGTVIPGLKKIAEDICKKPVVLVATHVHPDHTGSAVNEWDSIWINAADEVNVAQMMKDYKGKRKYLSDGQIFDLGGRQIEVVFTPGHTPGSTTFIDKDAHYGFSGDAFGSTNLLVTTSLSTVSSTCKRTQRFIEKYDLKFFYPGHYHGDNVETPQRVKDIAEICDGILDGALVGKEQGASMGLTHVYEDRGVRINYNAAQIR